MCMSILPACMSVHHVCVPDAHADQKKTSDPLELKSQMKMRFHVVLELNLGPLEVFFPAKSPPLNKCKYVLNCYV